MSQSKKWHLPFFLGENGRCQYNKLCKGCGHLCKQIIRAALAFQMGNGDTNVMAPARGEVVAVRSLKKENYPCEGVGDVKQNVKPDSN